MKNQSAGFIFLLIQQHVCMCVGTMSSLFMSLDLSVSLTSSVAIPNNTSDLRVWWLHTRNTSLLKGVTILLATRGHWRETRKTRRRVLFFHIFIVTNCAERKQQADTKVQLLLRDNYCLRTVTVDPLRQCCQHLQEKQNLICGCTACDPITRRSKHVR